MLMETFQFSEISVVDFLTGRYHCDIAYADDIAPLGSHPIRMQLTVNNAIRSAAKFGVHISPSKCIILLEHWLTANTKIVLARQSIEIVEK